MDNLVVVDSNLVVVGTLLRNLAGTHPAVEYIGHTLEDLVDIVGPHHCRTLLQNLLGSGFGSACMMVAGSLEAVMVSQSHYLMHFFVWSTFQPIDEVATSL